MSFTFTNAFGDTVTVALEPDTYAIDNRLAILAFEPDGCLYTTLTVNLGPYYPLDPDEFFLDTNNVSENLIKVLEKEGIFERTGQTRPSGRCLYPICRLTQKGIDILRQTTSDEELTALFDDMAQAKKDRKENE